MSHFTRVRTSRIENEFTQ